MTSRSDHGTIPRVDWMMLLGWLPLLVGLVAASMLLAYQLEMSALALFALLGALAVAHAMDPPIAPHAPPDFFRSASTLWPLGARLGVEVLAVAAVLTLWRNLRDRDEVEAVQWENMDSVRRLAEFFESSPADPEERRTELFTLGCKLLDLDLAVLCKREADRHCIEATLSIRQSLVLACEDEAELATTLAESVIVADRALGHEDTHKLASRPARIRSYLGAPVRVHGAVYGTLAFASPRTRAERFRGIDKHLVGLMAGWLGRDLEREAAHRGSTQPGPSEPAPTDANEAPARQPIQAARVAKRAPGSAWAPRSLDPNDAIRKLEKRLRAGLGPDHSLELDLSPETPWVAIARPLFVQVLFGLVANGIEALPDGGALAIESQQLASSDTSTASPRYATVSVRCKNARLDGARLIERMDSAPDSRDDGLGYRRIRQLLSSAGGDHSVHCEADGSVILTVYLPALESAPTATQKLRPLGPGVPFAPE